MNKFAIYHGLGGGFGGAQFDGVREFNSHEEAEQYAYQAAVEEYESMQGMYGLRTLEEIMEEEGVDIDVAYMIEADERESWIEYYAEAYAPTKHD